MVTTRGCETRGRAGGRQKTGINHNYNQRARKLHEVRPLWPRDSWLPASHENLSPNFGFLQGRCLLLLCIRVASFMVFHEFPGELHYGQASFGVTLPRAFPRRKLVGTNVGNRKVIIRRAFPFALTTRPRNLEISEWIKSTGTMNERLFIHLARREITMRILCSVSYNLET